MPISTMTIPFVRDSLAACGVPLPADAQRAADVLAALQSEATRDVVGDALAAAAHGALTAKNAAKRVQDLAVALTARGRAAEAAGHYERPVLDQFRQAIAVNIDDLIVAMRPYFDQAAEVFHTAGSLLQPGTAAPDARDGAEAVSTYLALDQASQQFSQVRTARVRITELAGYAVPDVTWFIESAANAEALDMARALFKVSPHRLTHAGYRLRLNTRAEAKQVEAKALGRSRAADVEAQQARVAANRDPIRDAAYAKVLGQ